jgi:hypothetical protein
MVFVGTPDTLTTMTNRATQGTHGKLTTRPRNPRQEPLHGLDTTSKSTRAIIQQPIVGFLLVGESWESIVQSGFLQNPLCRKVYRVFRDTRELFDSFNETRRPSMDIGKPDQENLLPCQFFGENLRHRQPQTGKLDFCCPITIGDIRAYSWPVLHCTSDIGAYNVLHCLVIFFVRPNI